jgi:hypothetical protein
MGKGKNEGNEIHCTDIEAIKDNAKTAVDEFARQYLSMPKFTIDCTVMDQRQLRDAMGLRATIEAGDPWPDAEQQLLDHGFRWHMLGGTRVMYLKERDNYEPDDGWSDGEEIYDHE